jgi:hypothetical protein
MPRRGGNLMEWINAEQFTVATYELEVFREIFPREF